MKYVKTHKSSQYEDGFPSENLLAMQDWLQDRINEIPEEYRKEATVEFETSESYGNTEISVEVAYRRPFTKAEIAENAAKRAATVAGNIAYLEAQLSAAKQALIKADQLP